MPTHTPTDVTGATDLNDLVLGTDAPEDIEALAGDDIVLAGGGDDVVDGGDGNDILLGEDGDDVLEGELGDDVMLGGAGNDRMLWDNGDGSDIMEGGEGYDVAEVEGAEEAGDVFVIGAGEDGRIDFARTNLGPFTLDIGTTERLVVNGLGGDDVITGSEGLDGLIDLALFGGAGNDRITGGDGDDRLFGGAGSDVLVGFRGDDAMFGGNGRDRMIWNNGDGSDSMNGGRGFDIALVNGSDSAGEVFEIAADGWDVDFARTNFGNFTLDISNTEVLTVRGGGGDDVITGGEGLAGLIDLRLLGNAGADHITGGDGDDLLNGGNGADVLVGFRGNDTMLGGNGQDRMIWNNGDGSDLMNGGRGRDTVEVNGSDGDTGDVFEINGGGGRDTDFARTNFGQFTLDILNTETLEVNGGAGDDTIIASDDLWEGLTLRLDGGEGNDTLRGGNTDDVLLGGAGADTLNGAGGDDTLTGGTGADSFVFTETSGNDIITDFEQDIDVIDLTGVSPDVFDQSFAEQVGDDVVLTIGDATLTLIGQDLADFSDADFIFPEIA